MDWIIPAITAAAGLIGGLVGAWIIGRSHIRAQEIAQRAENIRSRRRLAEESVRSMRMHAYEAAMLHWKTIIDKYPDLLSDPVGNPRRFIERHILCAALLINQSDSVSDVGVEIFEELTRAIVQHAGRGRADG